MTRMSYLYTPGDSNGWNQEQSQRLYSFDSVKFNGYALLSGAFKFTSQPNWDGVNYGFGGEEELSALMAMLQISRLLQRGCITATQM